MPWSHLICATAMQSLVLAGTFAETQDERMHLWQDGTGAIGLIRAGEQSAALPVIEAILKAIDSADSHFRFAPDIVTAIAGYAILPQTPNRGRNCTCSEDECVAWGLAKSNPFVLDVQVLQGGEIEVQVGDYTQGESQLKEFLTENRFEFGNTGRKTSGFMLMATVCALLVRTDYNNSTALNRHNDVSNEQLFGRFVEFLKSMSKGKSGWGDYSLLAKVADYPEIDMRFDYATSRPGFACTVNWGKL